jgi:hypothetical protein
VSNPVMGLSMPAAKKRRLYSTTIVAASVEKKYNSKTFAAMSVDCNAELRSCLPYNPTHTVADVEVPWSVGRF